MCTRTSTSGEVMHVMSSQYCSVPAVSVQVLHFDHGHERIEHVQDVIADVTEASVVVFLRADVIGSAWCSRPDARDVTAQAVDHGGEAASVEFVRP